MDLLFNVHSLLRWFIVTVGALALLKFLFGWLLNNKFGKLDRALGAIYSGLLDVQVTLGLFLLLWTGFTGAGFPILRLEHGFAMIVAAVVAHLPTRMKSAAGRVRFRNAALAVLISLAIIYLGVAVLPEGWSS